MSKYSIQELAKLIEKTRKEMIDLSKEKAFSDPEIIKISQKLDALLNELERLKEEDSE